MSKTAINTHRRDMRTVTPVVRYGRTAAGAALAAGVLFGGTSAATAGPNSDEAAPQAEGVAAPAPAAAVAPAVTLPAAENTGEGEQAGVTGLAPAAGSITIEVEEPEPVVVEEPEAEDEDAEETEGTSEERTEDETASRDSERSSRVDDEDEDEDEDSSSEGESEESAPASSAGKGSSILATARSGIGTPYVYGGSSPSGWDCSGFVQWVYKQHGIDLPRTAGAQAARGTVISKSEARPGDLVYKPGHIGIYAGGNQFVDAGNSRVDTSERNIYSGSWTYIRI
ncbi:MAG TPA: C40 family peptidase [Candidatus Brachybacterium merdigallinarum]|nr:C40 family peptidase [Candidatus Brachybacterium merdigallinarum]